MTHPDSTMKNQHVADNEFLWAPHFPKLSLKQFLARPFWKNYKNVAPWQHHEKPTCCWQWIFLGSTFTKIIPKAISGQTIVGKVAKMMHPDSTMKNPHVADKELSWVPHLPKLSLMQFLAKPFLEKSQKGCTLGASWKTNMLLTMNFSGLHNFQNCP